MKGMETTMPNIRTPFAGLIPQNTQAVIDGWMADGIHHYPMLVQFEDTDAGGIVYHANYLSFAERGRSGWLRLIGVSQSENLYENKNFFVVRSAHLSYIRPAKLGDELIVQTTLKELGKARLTADQTIISAEKYKKGEDGHIFAKVEIEIVMVNAKGRPTRFAPDLLEKMTIGV